MTFCGGGGPPTIPTTTWGWSSDVEREGAGEAALVATLETAVGAEFTDVPGPPSDALAGEPGLAALF